MIEYKIKNVPDHVCTHCSQCWMGECRAYMAPHSEVERMKREGGKAACGGDGELEKLDPLVPAPQESPDVLVLRGEEFYDG